MNQYDITIITKEDLGIEPVKKEIEALAGNIISSESLGQKKFTYEIKKETTGFYTKIIFEIEPEKLIELNKKLALKGEILRFLILTFKKTVLSPEKKSIEVEKIADKKIDEKVEEIIQKEKKEESNKEVVKEKPKKVAKKEAVEIVEAKEIKEEPKKISKATKEIEREAVSTEERLKALDKKLDELLKE